MSTDEHTPECAAFTVNAFCKAHSISRSLFYKGLAEGWGPVTMKVASRTLVSVEAAADWRHKMEQASKDAA